MLILCCPIAGVQLAFICEDDVFVTSLPRASEPTPPLRLTLDQCCENPVLSPDGTHVAYTNYFNGTPEICLVAVTGGPSTQVTFLGATYARVCGWAPDSSRVVICSTARQIHAHTAELFSVAVTLAPHCAPVYVARSLVAARSHAWPVSG